MKLYSKLSFVLIIALVLVSCRTTNVDSKAVSNAKIYLLNASQEKATYLYLNSFIVENNEYNGKPKKVKLTNKIDDEVIEINCQTAVFQRGDSFEVTEFAVFSKTKNLSETYNKFISSSYDEIEVLSIEKLSNEELFLIPTFSHENGKYNFGLYVIRLNIDKQEQYFPSSERLRIEVLSHKGSLLWSSNYMMNYLTVVGDISAKAIGDIDFYSTLWNGKTNFGESIEPKLNNIVYILPIQPKNYVVSKTLKPE